MSARRSGRPVACLNAAHWLQGTPLRRISLLTPRPSMPPGHIIAAGSKPGGGQDGLLLAGCSSRAMSESGIDLASPR